MELKKAQGGVSVGPYDWAKDDDVVEVPDEVGEALLAIKGGDFSRVEAAPAPVAEKPAAPAAKAPAAALAAPAEPAK